MSSTGGAGCFRAIRLRTPGKIAAAAAVDRIHAAGAVVSPGPGCVQLAPALVYEPDDLEELEHALRTGLDGTAERSS
ncbi:hypothetical protein NI17_009315 [Thermobifida halotolerans]|uniref:Uncharacterized protein n=1 Tax=Thermobifida halotolerans TaxID=483545 RepID=A0A399FZF0_9ACTN|nr:hypothetical protein [Thermobifida halotolerans]UOE21303.1 hypothetical protein NI17_009315 [Thermobifida halotolerans]